MDDFDQIDSITVFVMCTSIVSILLVTFYIKFKFEIAEKDMILMNSIWGFITEEDKGKRLERLVWNWRKLALAGSLVSSFCFFTVRKKFTERASIVLAVLVYLVWICGSYLYWQLILMTVADSTSEHTNKKDDSALKSNSISWSNKIKRDDKDKRLPVTIVTGYLGSGKTTLIQNILKNTVGMKVLVIENEVGEEVIDHELLLQSPAKPDIVLLNNGCVCCTVRGDLVRTFYRLFSDESFALLDWVVIETTGLADPAPVVQTLFMDPRCKQQLRLDCLLTVLDAFHFPTHVHVREKGTGTGTGTSGTASGAGDEARSEDRDGDGDGDGDTLGGVHGRLTVSEAVLQVSFADIILVNKVDLVSQFQLSAIEVMVKDINRSAVLLHSTRAVVPIEHILNIRVFDAARAKWHDNRHSQLRTLDYDPPVSEGVRIGIGRGVGAGGPFRIERDSMGRAKTIRTTSTSSAFPVPVPRSRSVVSTLSLTASRPLDLRKFNRWIFSLLQENGSDIFRIKGILDMGGWEERFVLQAVHMLMEGGRGQRWIASDLAAGGDDTADSATTTTLTPTETRRSRLVFIGRLTQHEDEIRKGFATCLL